MTEKTLRVMQEIGRCVNEHDGVSPIYTNSPQMKALIENTFGDKAKVEVVEVPPLGGIVRYLDQKLVDKLREPTVFEGRQYWGKYDKSNLEVASGDKGVVK